MNEQLMLIVEKAVRPVDAPVATKRRMREELYDLVSEIHAEETERGGTPEETLNRTRIRFGDPAELARELQSSLKFNEQTSMWIERRIRRQPGESILRHALRISLFNAGTILLLLLLVGIAKEISGTGRSGTFTFCWTFGVMYFLDFFTLSYLGLSWSERMANRARWAALEAKTWMLGIFCAGVTMLNGLAQLLFVTGGESLLPTHIQTWSLIGLAILLGFVGVIQAYQWEKRSVHEWEQLELIVGDL